MSYKVKLMLGAFCFPTLLNAELCSNDSHSLESTIRGQSFLYIGRNDDLLLQLIDTFPRLHVVSS